MAKIDELNDPEYEFIRKTADEYNVKVRLRSLDDATRGYTINGEIVLNKHLYPERRNWTFCHELGHLVLDHSEKPTFEEDREADKFAAELMLPEADFVKDSRSLNLTELKEIYPHASWEAIARRLIQFNRVVITIFDNGNLSFRRGSAVINYPSQAMPEEIALKDKCYSERRNLEKSMGGLHLKIYYIDEGTGVVRVIVLTEPDSITEA